MLLADTFTDTGGTAIASHTGQKGGAWTLHPNSVPSPTIQGNAVISNAAGAGWAYSAASPSSVNQEITAIILFGAAATNEVGVAARMDTTATTFYDVRFEAASGQFGLFKTVAAAETRLDTYTYSPVAGTFAYVTLNVTDTSKQVYLNGDLVMESTDNSIASAGKLGIRVKNNDVSGALLDRVWASDGYVGGIDSFNNGIDGGILTDRAGALRARWTKEGGSNLVTTQPGTPPNLGALPGARARGSDQFTCYYQTSAVPLSADYDVSCVVLKRSLSADSQLAIAGPAGRMATTGSPPDYYNVRYNSNQSTQAWELVKVSAGVQTILATWAEVNDPVTMRVATLEMVGTTINGWIDGVLRLTASDSSITAVGRPGMIIRAGTSTAMHDRVCVALFHFAGTTLSDASGPSTPTLSSVTPRVAAADCVWTSVSDVGSAGLLGYRLEYRATGASGVWARSDTVSTGTTGSLYGLPTGASLDFRVRAEDNVGNLSLSSNSVAATPTVVPAQPTPFNDITGTHSGSVTVNQTSLTRDSTQKSVDYAGGKTTWPDDAAFDVGSAITMRAIVKPDTIPGAGTKRVIVSRDNAYHLKQNGSSLEGTIYVSTSPVVITASSVFSAGVTADVCMTYDGTTLALYKNGVSVASQAQSGSIDSGSADIVIGSLAGGTETFDGKIQLPEVLAEALNSTRLAQDALALI